jgi:hypothetical protein
MSKDSKTTPTTHNSCGARIEASEVIEALRLGDIVIREYINQQSAACYCGYSEQFFNKLCRAGTGPRHVRVGSRWRTRRIWLDQWMESGGPHGSLKKVES